MNAGASDKKAVNKVMTDIRRQERQNREFWHLKKVLKSMTGSVVSEADVSVDWMRWAICGRC